MVAYNLGPNQECSFDLLWRVFWSAAGHFRLQPLFLAILGVTFYRVLEVSGTCGQVTDLTRTTVSDTADPDLSGPVS